MHRLLRSWVLAACGLSGLFLAGPAFAGEEAAGPWRDQRVLEARFAEAIEIVEEICGATFERRPTVRLSDAQTIAPILERELAELPAAVVDRLSKRAMIRRLADALCAKYVFDEHAVHVLPEKVAAERSRAPSKVPLGEDHMRVLLVHEATHALDAERFQTRARFRDVASADALHALGAVLEGHAQWVAREAANRWKIPDAFDRLTSAIVDLPEGLDEDARREAEVVVALTAFPYVQGLSFMTAVGDARGRAGLDAVLRDPPTSTRVIEDPARWLAPDDGAVEPDVKALLAVFRTLTVEPPWKVQERRVTEALLRSQAGNLPEAQRAGLLEGYEDGRLLTAEAPSGMHSVMAMALLYADVAGARAFVAAQRAQVDGMKRPLGADALQIEDGTGPGGAMYGFSVGVDWGGTRMTRHTGAVDRIAFSLVVVGAPTIDRAAQDRVIEHVAVLAEDPEAVRARELPASPPFHGRLLTVRVVDPEGQPVPIAQVAVRGDRDLFPMLTNFVTCRDGVCTLPVDHKGSLSLAVWGARAADDTPLPLAPVEGVPLDADGDEMTIRLEAGEEITGRVLDAEDAPVGGVRVAAHPVEHDWVFGPEQGHGQATTDDEGAFRIRGLAPREYELRLTVGGKPATPESPRVPAGTRGLEITLRATVDVAITVLDPDGQPVAGATVQATAFGIGAPGFLALETTDAGGRVTLAHLDPQATYHLRVRAMDRTDVAGRSVFDWAPADTEIRLPRGWTVRGVVRDEAGKGVVASVQWRQGHNSGQVRTSSGGAFSCGGLADEPVEVRALPVSHLMHRGVGLHGDDTRAPWTEVRPGDEDVALILADVPAPRRVTVRVLGPDGEPVADASVRIGHRSPRGHSARTHRAQGGRLTVTVPEGPFTVSVSGAKGADGRPLPYAPTRIEGGATDTTVEVRMEVGATLEGRVRTEAGEGVMGAQIWVGAPGGFGPTTPAWSDVVATSGKDGRFVLVGLGHGGYEIHCRPPAPHVTPAPVLAEAGGGAVEIVLRAGIELLVVDWQDAPVPRADVTVMETTRDGRGGTMTRSVARERTDARGIVRLRAFPDDAELKLEVEVRSRNDLVDVELDSWRATGPRRIVLGRAFTATVTVRDGDGPVTGAQIEWRVDRGPPQRAGGWRGARTASDGTANVPRVPHGAVELRAIVDGARYDESRVSPWVAVTPDAPRATLTLPGGDATELLLRAPAAAGHNAVLRSRGEPRVHRSFTFDAEGTKRLELFKGRYEVYARDLTDDTCLYAEIDVTGDDVTLEPVPAKPLRFRLEVPDGSKYLEATVRGPLGRVFAATRGEDGIYRTEPLPPGRWTVTAKARAPDAWVHGEAPMHADEIGRIVLAPK